ncbi:MAG: 3D domain-containing protein [Pyrinomonadaceae bacterium]
MKSLSSGSAVTAVALIAGTLFIYARPLVAETNSLQQPSIQQQKREEANTGTGTQPVLAGIPAAAEPIASASTRNSKAIATEALASSVPAETGSVLITSPAETYVATCYSLRGRTASGKMVANGLIAADPRVLPLGSRVRLDAGPYSGEYLVADTGGLIRGRHVDIWTPSTRDAMRFGRRKIKVTVLSYGVRHRPRRVKARS